MKVENFSYASVVPVTPNDAQNLPRGLCRAIYTGSGGAIALQAEEGVTVTLANLPAGQSLDLKVQRVLATGTTATGIHAFY